MWWVGGKEGRGDFMGLGGGRWGRGKRKGEGRKR